MGGCKQEAIRRYGTADIEQIHGMVGVNVSFWYYVVIPQYKNPKGIQAAFEWAVKELGWE